MGRVDAVAAGSSILDEDRPDRLARRARMALLQHSGVAE